MHVNLCNCPNCQTDNCPAALDKAEITTILDKYLSITDDWGGCKLASWQWGSCLAIEGIEDAAEAIMRSTVNNRSHDHPIKDPH